MYSTKKQGLGRSILWTLILLSVGFSQVANSGLITDLIGDKDCFGLGGTCADGDHYTDDLGGSFFTDNRSAGEVLGVDEWDSSSGLGGPAFTFGLDLGGATALSASLEENVLNSV